MSVRPAAPPARTLAYYRDWIGELAEMNRKGMIPDEEYAYMRAERLEELMENPRRRWKAWILAGVPLALVFGAIAWRMLEDVAVLEVAGALSALCVLAAFGRLERERQLHLSTRQRSAILYDLLSEDLITSEEFLAFDERLTGRTQRGNEEGRDEWRG